MSSPVLAQQVHTLTPEPNDKKVKILLVDDTPENLVSLEAALDILGEELICAHSGREALRYLLDDNFAAILLDVKMPDMDGFETAELIRSRPRSRHTPILFLTGYKSEEHLFRGYDLGAVDFLFKPIVPEILRSKVAVFIELSRKAQLLEQQAATLRAQAAILEKAERQFRSLLEAAPDAMVICRENGLISLVNSRAELLFGFRRADLFGRPIQDLVPDWGYQPADAPDEDFCLTATYSASVSFELEGIHSNGSRFPVEITLSPLQSDEGTLITTAIRDISSRKRVEQARAEAEEQVRSLNEHLARVNAHLEERVLQRTEELVRSNDELAQFAYVASHDLQEPLRTVSLFTQLIARQYDGKLDENGRKYVSFITESAGRMEHLISDLLDFSRLDLRPGDHFGPVCCQRVLKETLSNLAARIDETDATIVSDELPEVNGNRTQLVRLFQNLITNSIKYRKPNVAPAIKVSAVRRNNDWLFSIADNGIGIDRQYFERIFGIFKRLHGRDNPGTGMGLAISKKIVNRHGGTIWVDSELGVGSTFYFTIPCLA